MLVEIAAVFSGMVAGAGAGMVAGAVFGYLGGWKFAHDLDFLKKRVDQLWGSSNSAGGVAAREAYQAETEGALMEAAVIFKEKPPENASAEEKAAFDKAKGEKMLALATKYPRVAMRLLRKTGFKF